MTLNSAAVGSDDSGRFVVAWSGVDADDSGVFFQRFDADATPLGSAVQVNTYTTSGQQIPAVAVEADGDFLVAWESRGSLGTDSDTWSIQMRRFASNGAALDPAEVQVNTYTTDPQQNAAVGSDADGNLVVVWNSFGSGATDSDGSSVQMRRFASDGSALDPADLQVNTHTTDHQYRPSVGVDADGDFVVAWESRGSSGTDSHFRSVQMRRFASDGSALDPADVQVNTYTTNSQVVPTVAAAPDGDFVVSWTSGGSSDTDTSSDSVQMRRFASDGSALDPADVQVNTYTTDWQYEPTVAADADGDFVVSWTSRESSGTDTSSASIQMRRFASDGTAIDLDDFQVNLTTAGYQGRSRVAVDADGEPVVIWLDHGSHPTRVQGRGPLKADFGDAPDPSYPTRLESDGARHLVPLGGGGLSLGASVDIDRDAQPNAGADGDDTDGSDDDDGVVFLGPVLPGDTAVIEVTASGTGVVDAWIDFGGDGSWAEPGDRILSGETVVAGAQSFPVPVPPGAVVGSTAGRFRLSTTGSAVPTGLADDGEVEDHLVPVGTDLAVSVTAPDPPEPGGPVVFAVRVDAFGAALVDLAGLVDDLLGDVTQIQGDVTATTCAVPQAIPGGGAYECTFTATVAGNAGSSETHTTTATGSSGIVPLTASDDEAVTITDVPPTAPTVSVTADPTNVDEPGAPVDFTVTITNTAVEDVELTALSSTRFGDVTALPGDCAVSGTLAIGGSSTCTFTADVSGPVGPFAETVTATVRDDETNAVAGAGGTTVTITDLAPSAPTVAVVADPTTVDEPGAPVDFSVTVTNTAVEDVELTALSSAQFGDVTILPGDCSVPGILAIGGSSSCTFTADVSGPAGPFLETMTATVEDDESNTADAFGGAIVTIVDVPPVAPTVAVAADTTILPPSGGPVSFTIVIENEAVEGLELTSISSVLFGDATALPGDCTVPWPLAVGDSFACSFTGTVSGPAGTVTETVTATVEDDEGNVATGSDDVMLTTLPLVDVPTSSTAGLVALILATLVAGLRRLRSWRSRGRWHTT